MFRKNKQCFYYIYGYKNNSNDSLHCDGFHYFKFPFNRKEIMRILIKDLDIDTSEWNLILKTFTPV